MMRNIVGWIASLKVRCLIALRYRVTLKGVENIPTDGGVLFLPNHPALIDPVILSCRLWPKWKIRPLVTEYIFYTPGLHWVFTKLARAIPIPAFVQGTNTYKEKRSLEAYEGVKEGLTRGDNFLVYPSGRLKRTPEERVGGSTSVYGLVNATPNVKPVLVRTTGLWGSVFGWGVTGTQPELGRGFAFGFKTLLKNLIFFTPRRKVTIEFERAGETLLEAPSPDVFNRILEGWYNAPQPEELQLVSYSCWRKEIPEVTYDRPYLEADVSRVPPKVKQRVIRELATLAKVPEGEITPEKHVLTDLHLDSLDVAELVFALEKEEGGIAPPSNIDLLTVGAVMALAAGLLPEKAVEVREPPKGWKEKERLPPAAPEGETIGEAFLRTCDRMGKAVACADERSGLRTYPTFKRRALLLAGFIRKMPGERIGVLLPASVAVSTVVMACYLAGKVPVMLNWTLGRRYLEHVKAVSGIHVVLSSWAFLDRMEGADLTPIHEEIVPLEGLMSGLTIPIFWRACRFARLRAPGLMKKLQIDTISPNHWAVILFTSGTEAAPKAVPLSHHNILSNQRAGFSCVDYSSRDSFLSVLPPFHSLGFSLTGLLPLLVGGKVVFSPNPTDPQELARVCASYKPTIFCSAPTFLQSLLRAAKPGQLTSLSEVITGAEKAPPELFDKVEQIGARLLEGYGITECAPLVTVNRPDEPSRGVGRAIPGVTLRIVDPDAHTPLETGEVGLILTAGPNVFDGYLGEAKDPFLTLDGTRWYNTGDLGSLDGEGYLLLSGRLKRFVKIGGEMISLPALEAVLEGEVKEEGAILAVLAKEEEGKRPTLHLIANVDMSVEFANRALKEAGFSNLARLASFHKVDEIPLLGTGKVNYRALQELLR